MTQSAQASPAFGQADLSNCEREQIHLAGSIQPHGALVVLDERSGTIVQTSINAPAILGLPNVLGLTLAGLGGDIEVCLSPHLAEEHDGLAFAVRCHLGRRNEAFDVLLHRPAAGILIIEFEKAVPIEDPVEPVEAALQTILASSSLETLCAETARIYREITGYDRVMVYRFDDHGHGQVFSEHKRADLTPYLGNWYPASDIPQIARRLYERNRIRVLVNVNYEPVPIEPRLSPATGGELDMSLCVLRSSSPIHVQYLKNMEVVATLVVSLMVGGKLWGLISCHHYSPKFVHFELRALCEVLAEAVSTRIAALETFAQARAEMSIRRLEQRMIEAISREGDWTGALFENPSSLLQPLGASGAALCLEDQVESLGDVPGTRQIRQICAWLDARGHEQLFSSSTFATDVPQFTSLKAVASGLLAVTISNLPGAYLLWFRPERVRTVTWGGDPTKPVVIGDRPSDLSPRRSFAQWHQLVTGTSEPWTTDNQATARLIGGAVSDVAVEHQAVRSLIVHEQMERLAKQIKTSGFPLVTADSNGRIILANTAFHRLLGAGRPRLHLVRDLASLFVKPDDIGSRLAELTGNGRGWRGEVLVSNLQGGLTPFMMRADVVVSPPDRLMGYVFLFSDLSEQKAAETARRRFQDSIIQRNAVTRLRLDSRADLIYQNVLSSIIENAQLAALEITDSEDVSNIPSLLESVRDSVTRTAAVLEALVWHAMSDAVRDDASQQIRIVKRLVSRRSAKPVTGPPKKSRH